MSTSQPPLVLLQTSDWHVGSALTGHGLSWPAELRTLRQSEIDGAAERAVVAARSVEADGMLVPGDLWDAESLPASTLHRLLEALESFAPRPVFVAPGNHDFAGAGGWYDPAVLAALGMRAWPDNVFVFRQPDWTSLPFPGRPDAAVVGRAFLSNAVLEMRALAVPPSRPPVAYPLLLLHGSYEEYHGLDAPVGSKKTAPFSRGELLSAGFSWAALGHHHHLQVISEDSGRPRAAYSGSPTGRGLDETGPRSFLKVTLFPSGAVELEAIPSDTRMIHEITVDLTDLDSRELLDRTAAALEREKVGTGDIVRVTLTGAQTYGARGSVSIQPLSSRVAHLAIRDRSIRSGSTEIPGIQTAEGRFVADLLAQREGATDPERKRVIELALALGRDALAGRTLEPPAADEA